MKNNIYEVVFIGTLTFRVTARSEDQAALIAQEALSEDNFTVYQGEFELDNSYVTLVGSETA